MEVLSVSHGSVRWVQRAICRLLGNNPSPLRLLVNRWWSLGFSSRLSGQVVLKLRIPPTFWEVEGHFNPNVLR